MHHHRCHDLAPRRARHRPRPQTRPGTTLPALLATALVATLCGHHRYRAIARFARVHEATLRRAFAIKTVPSHVTLTSVLARLDAHALARALEAFVAPRALAGTPVAIDGKAIRASMHHHGETEQDFAAVASAFTHRIGPRSGHRSGSSSGSSSGGGLVIASEPYSGAHAA